MTPLSPSRVASAVTNTVVSVSPIASAVINTCCALANVYIAPKSFAFSFAAGVVVGLGLGAKRRFNLFILNACKDVSSCVCINNLETRLSAQGSITQAFDKRISPRVRHIVRPVFSAFLFLSGFKNIEKVVSNLTGNFYPQRGRLLKQLDVIPGWKGTLFSLTACASNLNAIAVPILSRSALFSGFTPGYAAGLYLIKKTCGDPYFVNGKGIQPISG